MARKLPSERAAAPRRRSSAVEKTADDLQVLRPDIAIEIAGESITVREYTFWESMDIVYRDRGFLDDVVALLNDSDRDPWEAVRSLFGRHAAYLKVAAAASVNRDVAWIEQLGARDTDILMSSWWAVNGHFFIHEATVVIKGRMTRARSAGSMSSPGSPLQASATPIASAVTPSAS
jgi:hypothetical protein